MISTSKIKERDEPVTFIIFGATGDLALLKLIPALFRLFKKGYLSSEFRIVGFARRPFTNQEYRALVASSMSEETKVTEDYQKFLQQIAYQQGQFDEEKTYRNLMLLLDELDDKMGSCSHKIFHFAISPFYYETVLTNLNKTGLTISCTDGSGRTRVLLEKPIGTDGESAEHIQALLSGIFREDQIFRIDHYLAKRGVSDFLMFRYENPAFETVLNADFVEEVFIEQFETRTIEGRGGFYDHIGALRDVGQNQLLEILALIAMERPRKDSAEAFSLMRAQVLSELIIPDSAAIERKVKRGQYKGYLEEEGVAPFSNTETYFRIPVFIKSHRWRRVPFVITSGKALLESRATIRIIFRRTVEINSLVDKETGKTDILVFSIQPESRVEFCERGLKSTRDSYTCAISTYEEVGVPASTPVDEYERIYLDALAEDKSIFVSRSEVKAAWKYIDGIVMAWREKALVIYKKGSNPDDL